MGITIHYSGKLDAPRVLPALLTAARHFCFQRKWRYVDVDDRILGKLDDGTPIDDLLRGIIAQPHPESESVWLTFNQQGELCFYHARAQPGHYWKQSGGFTKTQFAPLDVHISICELLQLIRDKYFPSLRVVDEGEYWETRDPAHLAQNFDASNTLIDQLVDTLRKHQWLSFERGAKIAARDPLWKRGYGRSEGRN